MLKEIPIPEITDTTALQKLGISLLHRNIKVTEEIRLELFEAHAKQNFTVLHSFENETPRIGFNFCLQGATSYLLTGRDNAATADTKKVNNFLMPVCGVAQELRIQSHLLLVVLYIDLPAFKRLLGASIEALPRQLLDYMHIDNKCYFESYQWQPIIRSVLTQILHAQLSPLAERIFIESKSLELIAMILDIYAKGNQKQFSISKSDVEKIQYAKEILLTDIANPPSLAQLAKKAGTNEYTLKKGFKEIFNIPVFKYLQQMRLAKAYELFQATNLQVNEVATIVGYDSISSFNRAFYQYYNMKPGDVKRIPFKTI